MSADSSELPEIARDGADTSRSPEAMDTPSAATSEQKTLDQLQKETDQAFPVPAAPSGFAIFNEPSAQATVAGARGERPGASEVSDDGTDTSPEGQASFAGHGHAEMNDIERAEQTAPPASGTLEQGLPPEAQTDQPYSSSIEQSRWWDTRQDLGHRFYYLPPDDPGRFNPRTGSPERVRSPEGTERLRADIKDSITAEQVNAVLRTDPTTLPEGTLRGAFENMQQDYRWHLTGPTGESLPTAELREKFAQLRAEGVSMFHAAGHPANNDFSGQIVWAQNGTREGAEVEPVYIRLVGVPDFSNHMLWDGADPKAITLPDPPPGADKNKVRSDDIRMANIFDHGNGKNIPDYTWHHVDGTIGNEPVRAVIAVKSWIHNAIKHGGGVARAFLERHDA